MPSTLTGSRSTSIRFVWLAAAIVAGGALWTAGWFFIASNMESQLPAVFAEAAGPDGKAECEQPVVRGYPFRFGLFCDRFAYTDGSSGIAASAGALRSAAQFYRPGHVVAELDGPLTLTAPGLIGRVDWQLLQASVRASAAGLERGSIDGRGMSIDLDGNRLMQKITLQADRFTVHTRRNGPDLDIAAFGERLQSGLAAGFAAAAFALEATLPGQAAVLDIPNDPKGLPQRIVLHRATLDIDPTTSIGLSGPLEIDTAGQISGDLQLLIRNPERVSDLIAGFDGEWGQAARQIAPLAPAFDTAPDDDGVTLPVTIRAGLISIGVFALGRLPAL